MAITPLPDSSITRQVQSKLLGRGLVAPCRISVQTVKGLVTLSGSVRSEQQKTTALEVTRGITGVKQVANRLTVIPAAKR